MSMAACMAFSGDAPAYAASSKNNDKKTVSNNTDCIF